MAGEGPTKKAQAKRPQSREPAARILDMALDMAAEGGWSALRLSDVAARLGVPPAEIQRHFRDKDAVADAWFDRAWQAMLAAPSGDFADLPADRRLHLLLMRWFDALAPHRDVTGQMLREKLYPSHPHHWVPLIFNLSRTIQWLRDAALLEAQGRRRQVEEVGLTGLFLATFRVWLSDDSDGQAATRAYLERRLERADRLMARVFRRAPAPADGGRSPQVPE